VVHCGFNCQKWLKEATEEATLTENKRKKESHPKVGTPQHTKWPI